MYVALLDGVTKISKTIFLHYFFLFTPKTDFNWPVFELADSLFFMIESAFETVEFSIHSLYFPALGFLFVSGDF